MGILSKLVAVSLTAASLVNGDGMNARAKLSGRYMGIALSPNEVSDTAFMSLVNNIDEVGSLVPGNAMKWDATEGRQNVFSYRDADATVARAQNNGQMMRCHTLVWHKQVPAWVTNGGFNNATLIAVMKNHITNVVTHFKGKCDAWDVVNEALNEDGSLRSSIFSQVIGEAFIPIAFAAAAAADPDAKLYYNDYNTDRLGGKSIGAQNIVKMVRRYGVKIDGVGCQAHLSAGQSPSLAQLQANLEGFANLGVDVAYTELDIGISGTPTSTTLQRQAVDYGNVVTACKNVPRCVGITMWGLQDKYTWRQNDSPLPFDRQFQKKPAYTAILNAWGTGGQQPTRTTTTARMTGTTTMTGAMTMTTTSRNNGNPGTVPRYGQCGGSGWTGGTSCMSPYTCKLSNEWYSQCL